MHPTKIALMATKRIAAIVVPTTKPVLLLGFIVSIGFAEEPSNQDKRVKN